MAVAEVDRLERAIEIGVVEECSILSGIRDALALLEAIDQGELLAALPEDEDEVLRHELGLTLLEILKRRLREAVGSPDGLISGECSCDGKHCMPA